MQEVTLMLSSAGRRGALIGCFRDGARALGVRLRIVALDCSPLSAAGHLADRFYLVPKIDEASFLDSVEGIARTEKAHILVPTIDTELGVFARGVDRIERCGTAVSISSSEVVMIAQDKRTSSQWLIENGFHAARQYSDEELASLPFDRWPLFFKPVGGSSSVGAQLVESLSAVRSAVDRYGLGVVEDYIEGDEYTLDCWINQQGLCLAVVPRLRLATRAGEVAKGITVRAPLLEAETRKLVESLPGARGVITVQAIVREGTPFYIEINPRFGGGYPLSHAAGANYTAALLAETLKLPFDPELLRWTEDLIMLRYDEAIFVREEALAATPWRHGA